MFARSRMPDSEAIPITKALVVNSFLPSVRRREIDHRTAAALQAMTAAAKTMNIPQIAKHWLCRRARWGVCCGHRMAAVKASLLLFLLALPALAADEFTLYELLPPDTHQFAITY